MTVVVVESPAKAKTINQYLGSKYIVLASYGHVRDLPPKTGSVDPSSDFKMQWEVDSSSQKHLKAIADSLAKKNKLILATDPDREGEAISWHLLEALQKRRAIKKTTTVERVVFNAITKKAITEAMKTPRTINMPLVEAYLARRALDYLVGFNLSPVLWRKLPGSRSAGRVQSVSLRLIVEREMEIESFRGQEYWSIKTLVDTEKKDQLEAKVTMFKGQKLEKMSLKSEIDASTIVKELQKSEIYIHSIQSQPKKRHPFPPFMTSTLQQEAGRKLGFGVRQTMSAAQKLYEVGLITYMRTDGIDMDPDAVNSNRAAIKKIFGSTYLPKLAKVYKNKAKNAQEAHECIRPTDIFSIPEKTLISDKEQANLYNLIWKRTISSQMESATFEATSIEIMNNKKTVGMRSSGQVMLFDGFLKVYNEGTDSDKGEENEISLPKVESHNSLKIKKITPEQHFTQPPSRYTEATLVKKMEELGIGRPSTYASTVVTLLDREYVKKDKNKLLPEDKGRLVTIFLTSYFNKYLEYDYTADLEKKLDRVSAGEENWKLVLNDFWNEFTKAISETSELRITDVLEKLNDVLSPHIFPVTEEGIDPRICKKCLNGKLSMRTSRAGSAFIGCSNYPECKYTRPLKANSGQENDESQNERNIGVDSNNQNILLKIGRFGPYLELQNSASEEGKPKRVSIPKGMKLEEIDLEVALKILSLPRILGKHPEDGLTVEAAIGRYGPYVKHGSIYATIKDAEEVLTIGMNRAVELLAEKKQKPGGYGTSTALKVLGDHPDGGSVDLMDGKYGPYVKWKKVNATISKSMKVETITLEEALVLIANKLNKKRPKKGSSKK